MLLQKEPDMNLFYIHFKNVLLLLTACLFCRYAYTQTHFNQPVINKYSSITKVFNINPEDADSIEITNPEHFKSGDFVLFIVMKGSEIYTPYELPTSPSFWGKISKINNTGVYSIHNVIKAESDIIILTGTIPGNPFKTGEVAQLVHIPVVQTAILDTILTCKPWDHLTGTGGVLVLMATRKIIMNKHIDVSGKGFRGADPAGDYFTGECSAATELFYTIDAANSAGLKGEGIVYEGFPYKRGYWYVSNAGGGGNGKYSGGGGGGNRGPGGWAGKEVETCSPVENYGGSGRHIPSDFFTNEGEFQNRLFMGGGGGTSTQNPDSSRFATPGGNGGGIVILITDTLQISSADTIFAGGESVIDTATAGAGGGGAGGTVVLDVIHYQGNLYIDVRGGNGGHTNAPQKTGPGGFGGGGFIWFSGNELPLNVKIDTANGKSGVWIPDNSHYGAITSSQISGNMLGNLLLPLKGTLFNCLDDKIIWCDTGIIENLPASTPRGGTGNYTFLWLQSTDKMNWDVADGVHDLIDYHPAARYDTMHYLRIVESGTVSDTSNILTIIHLLPIDNNIIVGGGIACENESVDPITQGILPLSGGTGYFEYLWEILSPEGYIPAPGANNNPNYISQPLSENTIYRRMVKSDNCYSYSNTVEYEIKSNPKIVGSPVSDTIHTGDSTTFHVLATGSDPLTYRWMHNNLVIEPAGSNELVIYGATLKDTGCYYCIVENDCGLTISDS
ncbi:MAG: hypothetical protein AMS27_04225, partial [Bacteroides sp. SM23_62_1]